MDWKRERDGLLVILAVVVVLGVIGVGGPVTQFASTLVGTFLGVLIALRVDDRLDGMALGTPAPVPAAESDTTEPEPDDAGTRDAGDDGVDADSGDASDGETGGDGSDAPDRT